VIRLKKNAKIIVPKGRSRTLVRRAQFLSLIKSSLEALGIRTCSNYRHGLRVRTLLTCTWLGYGTCWYLNDRSCKQHIVRACGAGCSFKTRGNVVLLLLLVVICRLGKLECILFLPISQVLSDNSHIWVEIMGSWVHRARGRRR